MSEYENKITRVSFAMSKEKDKRAIHALNIISAKHGGVSKSVRKSIESMYEWAFVPTMYIDWSEQNQEQAENFLKAAAAVGTICAIRSVEISNKITKIEVYEGCVAECYENIKSLAMMTLKKFKLNVHEFESDFYLLDDCQDY